MGQKVQMIKCEMKDFLEKKGILGDLKKVDVYLDYDKGTIYFVKQEDLGNIQELES